MYHHSQLQSDKKTADKANCRLSDCFTLKYKFMECKYTYSSWRGIYSAFGGW